MNKQNGRKMIEAKVAFWTNGHPLRECYSSGKVSLPANKRHGIPAAEVNFNTVAEIGPAIEKLLAKAGVRVHPSRKAKAYR